MGYYKNKQIELFEQLDRLREVALMADRDNLECRDTVWGFYSGARMMLEKTIGEQIVISEGYHTVKEKEVMLKSF